MLISLVVGLLLGALTVVFALQNITDITVTFLAWKIQGSLALMLLIAAGSGVIVSLLITLPEVVRNYFKVNRLKKHNKNLEVELSKRPVVSPVPPAVDSSKPITSASQTEIPKI